MATKKFKTISGYLRSTDMEMQYTLPRDNDEQRIAAAKAGQRKILNHLLPQLGLPKLDDNETSLAGIERLLAIGGTER